MVARALAIALAQVIVGLKSEIMKRSLIFSIVVLVLFIIAAGGAFYYFIYSPAQPTPAEKNRQAVNQKLQSGRELLNTNSPQSAIPWLQQAVSSAVDFDQKSRAELNLGAAYLAAGMPEQGIALLKEVSLNTNYPVGYRSTAAQNVIGYYKNSQNIDFALKNIFTGPTWSGFIVGDNQDATGLNLATKNAYLWILSFDTSTSVFNVYYTLANWYADDIKSQTGAAKAQDISKTKTYIQLGDAMYPKILAVNAAAKKQDPTGVLPFTVGVIGNALTLKARALAGLYFAGDASATFETVSSAFTQALSTLDSDPTGYSTGLYSHFQLADFLVRADPVANKAAVVKALSFIYSDPAQYTVNVFFQGFLKSYGAANSAYRKTQTWKDLVVMAGIDPQFKALLIKLGWAASDLK